MGLGLRVKTGKAIAVALVGASTAPGVLLRETLALSDPAVPESAQPYHAGLGLPADAAEQVVERASRAVRAAAERALHGLKAEIESRGSRVRAVGLVRASDTDPSTIRQPHMHAHAAEGALFYLVLAAAAARAQLPCFELLQKAALGEVAGCLEVTEAALAGQIGELGKEVGPPWRADEKAACAAAWMALLAEGRRRRMSGS